jgi:uncharacterized membrane protein YccF (DUF307 family)
MRDPAGTGHFPHRIADKGMAALFGQKAVSRAEYFGHPDIGTGPLGFLGNLLWLVLAGLWLALGHLITAIMLAITIVGIPFAWAHVKLAGLALRPIGTECGRRSNEKTGPAAAPALGEAVLVW